MRFIVSLSLILMAAPAAGQSALPAMHDPVFHLSVPAARYTNFQQASPSLLKSCGVTVSAKAIYRDWILGSAVEPSGTYYLLAGILKETPNAMWTNDPNGAFVRVEGTSCTAIDPADGVFGAVKSYGTDASLPIPSIVFEDLAKSAVTNFSRVYGTKAALIAAMKSQDRYPPPADEPLLAAALTGQP